MLDFLIKKDKKQTVNPEKNNPAEMIVYKRKLKALHNVKTVAFSKTTEGYNQAEIVFNNKINSGSEMLRYCLSEFPDNTYNLTGARLMTSIKTVTLTFMLK